MTTLFVILMLILSFYDQGGLCVDKSLEDQSINEIVDEELKPVLVNEHHYYLPQQTVFGSPGSSVDIDASKTSPPHLTINPSTTILDYKQSTKIVEEEPVINDDYIIPYSSYCVSETPSESKEESEFLLPSKDILHKSVVLSGYIETPSKTSDNHQASKISNLVSVSSDIQEGQRIGNTSTDI